jgi:hypothetical protein
VIFSKERVGFEVRVSSAGNFGNGRSVGEGSDEGTLDEDEEIAGDLGLKFSMPCFVKFAPAAVVALDRLKIKDYLYSSCLRKKKIIITNEKNLTVNR